jgi:hypothetical protein
MSMEQRAPVLPSAGAPATPPPGRPAGGAGTPASRKKERVGRRSRRRTRTDSDSGDQPVVIELSKSQVDQVVRVAGGGGVLSVLLSAVKEPQWPLAPDSEGRSYPAQFDDPRLSRSLLSGLLVLSRFPADGGRLGVVELARMLDMNTTTTHRYVTTLLAVGLVARDATTRKYSLIAVQ